jgi:hypothetical protein
MRRIQYLVALMLTAAVTDAFAGGPLPTPVPEISPTSISAGLALLAGGVLLVRSRLRR